MDIKHLAFLMVVSCAGWLVSGCDNGEGTAESAAQPQPNASLGQSIESLSQAPSASAPMTGPVPTVQVEFSESAPPEKQIAAVVDPSNAGYFQAEGDTSVPKTSIELLSRAVEAYEDRRAESDTGDGPTWPVLRDLDQLVRYRILRALPAAPPGKKFVLDPKTKVVSLAPQ